jgi:pilus assembly protein CpaB
MATSTKVIGKLTNPLVLLLAAGLLAAGVAWIAYIYLQGREESIKNELLAKNQSRATPKVAVVVPKTDAKVNTVLNNQVFVMRSIEADLVYPDTILADDFPSFEGQKLAKPLLKGRPVRLSDLVVPEVDDVASVVPVGRRAMTIDIDNLNSIAQSLRPNHRVDIFLMSKASKAEIGQANNEETSLEQATLFMQNMLVMATGKEFIDVNQSAEKTSSMVRPGEVEGARDSARSYDSVTLLVTPAEAARLLVGQKMGTYRVVLRGQKDLDPLQLATVRAADLMPGATKRRNAPTIELIVGGRGNNNTASQIPGASMTSGPPNAAQIAAVAQTMRDLAAARPAPTGGAVPRPLPSPANQPIPALR